MNQKRIAARVGRTRETIAAQLKHEDFQALQPEVNLEVAEEARSTLKGYVHKAAKDWKTASGVAAKRGDHKPAKDLLMHAGVIEPRGEPVGPQVTVIVGMPGHPALVPPSQEEIDATITEEAARLAGRTIDVAAQPQAPVSEPDIPSA